MIRTHEIRTGLTAYMLSLTLSALPSSAEQAVLTAVSRGDTGPAVFGAGDGYYAAAVVFGTTAQSGVRYSYYAAPIVWQSCSFSGLLDFPESGVITGLDVVFGSKGTADCLQTAHGRPEILLSYADGKTFVAQGDQLDDCQRDVQGGNCIGPGSCPVCNHPSAWSLLVDFAFTGGSTDAGEAALKTEDHAVAIAPNPSVNVRTLLLALSRAESVRITIYTADGRLVRKLLDEVMQPGGHAVEWDGKDAAGHKVTSGVYMVNYAIGSDRGSRKVVVTE